MMRFRMLFVSLHIESMNIKVQCNEKLNKCRLCMRIRSTGYHRKNELKNCIDVAFFFNLFYICFLYDSNIE